jgi:sodium-type flagellar protein MotY
MSLFMSLCVSLFLVMLLANTCVAQSYIASITDAEWKNQSSPFVCRLSHKIPSYGEAIFAKKAGLEEVFELRQTTIKLPKADVSVQAVAPAWRSAVAPVALGHVKVVAGNTPLRLKKAEFTSYIHYMDQGMQIWFTSTQESHTGVPLRIGLEAHRFSAVYKNYMQCIDNLIPYNFKQISRTVIQYEHHLPILTPAVKTQLDKIVRYEKVDTSVLGLIVDGHSDKMLKPEQSETNSKTQAEIIAAYLVEKGIPKDKIITRWHSDKFPIASNGKLAGRAQNRRVTVRLENAETRRDMEKKLAALKTAQEQAAAEKAAQEAAAAEPPPPAIRELIDLVEGQDLESGKQPEFNPDIPEQNQ